MEQRFCAGVGVGLENTPYFLVGIMLRGREACPDLRGMVGVVIYDSDPVYLAFIFKTAVCPGEFFYASF